MKPSIFFTIIFSFFIAHPAYAWRCGQKCPSSVFSGKLECQANNARCSLPRPRLPRIPEAEHSGFGHVPNHSAQKNQQRIAKAKAKEARRRQELANRAYEKSVRELRDKKRRHKQALIEQQQRKMAQAAENRRQRQRQIQYQREQQARQQQEQRQQQMGAAHELGRSLGTLFNKMLSN